MTKGKAAGGAAAVSSSRWIDQTDLWVGL